MRGARRASTRTSRRSMTCRTRRPATSARRRPSSASRHALHRLDLGADATDHASGAVVLTSKAWGQEGGNNLTAALVNPGAADEPLFVTRHRQRDHASTPRPTPPARSPARPPRSSPRSTPTRPPRRSSPRACTAPTPAPASSSRRPSTKLSDCLNAPRRATRAARDGEDAAHRQDSASGSKVGVFIYCQEHAREWGTPLVCLETAERLCATTAPIPRRRS